METKEEDDWFWVQLICKGRNDSENQEFIKSKNITNYAFTAQGIEITFKHPDGNIRKYTGHTLIIT